MLLLEAIVMIRWIHPVIITVSIRWKNSASNPALHTTHYGAI